MKRNLVTAFLLSVILVQGYFLFFKESIYDKMAKTILKYEEAHFDPAGNSTLYFPASADVIIRNKETKRIIAELPSVVKDAIIAQFIFPENPEQLRTLMRTIGEPHWKMDAAQIILIGRRLFQNDDYIVKMKIQGYYPVE